jgi:hypothetical protein
MHYSSTLDVGLDGHHESNAVAYARRRGTRKSSSGDVAAPASATWTRVSAPDLESPTARLRLRSWALWVLTLPLSQPQETEVLGRGSLTGPEESR